MFSIIYQTHYLCKLSKLLSYILVSLAPAHAERKLKDSLYETMKNVHV